MNDAEPLPLEASNELYLRFGDLLVSLDTAVSNATQAMFDKDLDWLTEQASVIREISSRISRELQQFS